MKCDIVPQEKIVHVIEFILQEIKIKTKVDHINFQLFHIYYKTAIYHLFSFFYLNFLSPNCFHHALINANSVTTSLATFPLHLCPSPQNWKGERTNVRSSEKVTWSSGKWRSLFTPRERPHTLQYWFGLDRG